MTTLFLKPGEGRTVDAEDGTPWPAEGMDAELSLFVRRRIADADLVEAERPSPESAEVERSDDSAGRPLEEMPDEEPADVADDIPLDTPPAAEPEDAAPRKVRGSKPAGDA